jgi:hypothetical protein
MRRKIFTMLAVTLTAIVFSVTVQAQQKFNISLDGIQENPPVATSGRGTCVLTLSTNETQVTISCSYSGLSSNVVGGHIHDNGPVGVNGPVRFNFNLTGGPSGSFGPMTFNTTPAQVADLRAKRWYVNIHTSNFTGGEIRGQVKIATTPFDFDGDGRTDIRVYRPADNGVYILNSKSNGISFNSFVGGVSLNSTNDDFDGDGRGDLVTFVADGTIRVWRILQTATNTVRQVSWGSTAATDQVVPADYDGDGKADVAIYRRGEGIWYIIRSSDNQTQAEVFGLGPNDIANVGDFDKDGKNDLTVIRGTTSGLAWFTRRSSDGATQTIFWGGAPAPASEFIFPSAQIDVDGDGRQDHLVMRDPNGGTTPGAEVTFYALRSSDNQPFVLQWGLDTDTRLFGDYDGDGKTDFVSRRTENGLYVWYIYQSSTGQGRAVTFGSTGDLLVEETEDDSFRFDGF